MGNKQDLIKEIIEHELQMFLAVRSRGRAACQENPDGFRFHRDAMFSGWPEEVLSSYHKDLLEAQLEGKNLLAIKYARMENLIPVINDNEIIDKIVAIQVGWVKEMVEKYPYLHRRGRPVEEDGPDSTSTKTYLGGELETYSDLTLGFITNTSVIASIMGKTLCRRGRWQCWPGRVLIHLRRRKQQRLGLLAARILFNILGSHVFFVYYLNISAGNRLDVQPKIIYEVDSI